MDYAVGAQWEVISGKDVFDFHSMGNGLLNTLYEQAPGTLVIRDDIHGFASFDSFFALCGRFCCIPRHFFCVARHFL